MLIEMALLEQEYPDYRILGVSQWMKILGVRKNSFDAACRRVQLPQIQFRNVTGSKPSLKRGEGSLGYGLPVWSLPRLIEGFTMIQTNGKFTHSWAKSVDMSRNFAIEAPSGKTFVYRYEDGGLPPGFFQ